MGLADTDVIATTAVDTFSTFLDVDRPENLGHVHFVDGNPGGIWCPASGVLDLDGARGKLKQSIIPVRLGLGNGLDRRYVFAPEACDEAGDGLVQGKDINARRAISDFAARFLRLSLQPAVVTPQ